jgi:hypothetical protein
MALVRGRYPVTNPSHLLNGANLQAASGSNSSVRSTLPDHRYAISDTAVLTTQVMSSYAIALEAGDVVTNISFKSGATAAGTPTNWWFALYSSAATPALLAQTADQLTAAWAANTTKTLALATAQLITTPGVYFISVMVKATTPPSLIGMNLGVTGAATGVLTGAATLAQTSGSALVATAPATITGGTAIVGVALGYTN